MAKKTAQKKKVSKRNKTNWHFPLANKNFMIAGIGLAIIVIGYILMSTGTTEISEPALPDGTWNNPMAVTIAPILLVIGYCVVIPYSIIKFFPKNENE